MQEMLNSIVNMITINFMSIKETEKYNKLDTK